MSSRINKSSTKFAPKRKQSQNPPPPINEPAIPAPLPAAAPLPIEEPIAPIPPKSISATKLIPSTDEIFSQRTELEPINETPPSTQTIIKAKPILSTGFGPSDPSLTKKVITPTVRQSSVLKPSPPKANGTSFGISKTGPQISPVKKVATVVKPIASGSNAKGGAVASGSGIRQEKDLVGDDAANILVQVANSKETGVEVEKISQASAAKGKGKKREKVVKPKPKAKSKKGKEKEIIEEEDGEPIGEDAGEAEVPVKEVKKKKAPAKPRAPKKSKSVEADDEEGVTTKKKSKVGRAIASKVDKEMFSKETTAEVDENGEEIEKVIREGGEESEEELPVIEPAIWTMSQLSTPRDIIGGRTSTRFEDCQKRDAQIKAARNLRRKKMRDRASRIKKGLDSPEPEEVEEEEEPVLKKDESRANSVAKKVPRGDEEEDEDEREMNRLKDIYGDDGEAGNAEAGPVPKDLDGEEEEEDDDLGELVETQYAPQMRIVNGEMVLDDASLEVDRSKDSRLGFTGEREVVEESANDRYINSATWGKNRKTEKWGVVETAKFYELLGQFGTDFEMIARLFPTRTRGQIKNKWMKEEKINSKGITEALMQRKDIDIENYAKVTGTDLSGPIPEDPMDKVKQLRKETEARDLELSAKFGANGRDMVPVEEDSGRDSTTAARLAGVVGRGKKRKQTRDEEVFNPDMPIDKPEESEEEEDMEEVERLKVIAAEVEEAAAVEKRANKKAKKSKVA